MPEPQTAPDPGLFGPDSVTWRVHGDPSMALGGLRALLLQALHPLAMAGIAQHSSFRTDPWGRLQRTAEYVATVTYGTTADAHRAGAVVRAVHAGLGGIEPESGISYRVADPHLLRWAHCAEADSFLTAYQRCGGRLTPAEADRYLAEQARAAALVGIDPASVAPTTAALRAYFRDLAPELRATAEARRALWFVMRPPMPLAVRAARPAWAWLTGVAFGLLPRWARRLYGPVGWVSAQPGVDLAAGLSGRTLRTAVRLAPSAIRDSPARQAALARLDTTSRA